jgi:hypothetical protein
MARKYIQHQTVTDLWWQYVAWVAERCPAGFGRASYSSFWRRWHGVWSARLQIRKSSQHAQCTICSGYSNYIHHARGSPEDKQAAAKRWHEHLKEQYRDRLIYWNIRQASRRPESNVLSIIIDSMDKTKCAWPQYTFRKNKDTDKWRRPRIVITCVMAHGYCCDFYLADDEEMFHGASTFCELLTRTLSRVRDICGQRGTPFPAHLVVQSDNTTSQAKNAEVQKFLAILVRKFKFHTIVLLLFCARGAHARGRRPNVRGALDFGLAPDPIPTARGPPRGDGGRAARGRRGQKGKACKSPFSRTYETSRLGWTSST